MQLTATFMLHRKTHKKKLRIFIDRSKIVFKTVLIDPLHLAHVSTCCGAKCYVKIVNFERKRVKGIKP